MTGADEPPALSPRCGRSVSPAWFRSLATASRTLPLPPARLQPNTNIVTGISGISTPTAGRAGLTANRVELTRLLWRLWSPNWVFDDATLHATTASFDNPDFVDVTIQSYRHRYGNAPGDPAYDALEAQLAGRPPIGVPTIVLHGEDDGVGPPADSIPRDRLFTRLLERRQIPRAGHFLSRENPQDVVAAVVRLSGQAA